MPPLCPPAPLRGLLVLVLCACFAVDDQRVVVLSIHVHFWHHTAVMVYLIPDLAITGGSDLLYIYVYIIPIWATQMNKSNTNPGFRLRGFQYQRKGCFSIRRMRNLSRSSH